MLKHFYVLQLTTYYYVIGANTFQIISVFTKIDVSCPSYKSLIRPNQWISVNVFALVSPYSKCLQLQM